MRVSLLLPFLQLLRGAEALSPVDLVEAAAFMRPVDSEALVAVAFLVVALWVVACGRGVQLVAVLEEEVRRSAHRRGPSHREQATTSVDRLVWETAQSEADS